MEAAKYHHMAKCAFFTLVRNEKFFLPLILKYYSKYFKKEDMYVLDHDSNDDSTINLECNRVPVTHEFVSHVWMMNTVKDFQKQLLKQYEYVLFAEADEIVFAKEGLDVFIQNVKEESVRCTGFDICQHRDLETIPYDPSKSVLSQRSYWVRSELYSKPLLASIPLDWGLGFHNAGNASQNFNPHLILMHLHKFDFNTACKRHAERKSMKWNPKDLASGWGVQWQVDFESRFWCGNLSLIPESIKQSNAF